MPRTITGRRWLKQPAAAQAAASATQQHVASLSELGINLHGTTNGWIAYGSAGSKALQSLQSGPQTLAALKSAFTSTGIGAEDFQKNLGAFQNDFANLPSQVKVGLSVNIDQNGVETFSTKWSEAFAKFQTNASAAQTAGDLFAFTLQKLSGKDLTATQQLQSTSDAILAVGQAFTAAQTAGADLASKKAALDTALKGGNSSDIASAERDLTAAQQAYNTALATANATMKGNSVVAQQAQAQIAALIAADTQGAIDEG